MSSNSPEGVVAPSGASIKLRSYQNEMLERSLQQNIIVAMDTGSGKTHIAVARIRAELERTKDDKVGRAAAPPAGRPRSPPLTRPQLVWFLAPSRTLAEQQFNVLETELSAYGVRLLTGSDGVDKWTDQRPWDAVLTNVRVVIATPAVLRDALSHAFVSISRLALCVFDEAHRCTKKHPMNQIMELFYRPAMERRESVPHILGLSASPVMSTKQGSLQTIESNMHALAVTPKVHRVELETYVYPPELQIIRYSSLPSPHQPATQPLCQALALAAQLYDVELDPYVVELRELDDARSSKILSKVLLKQDTYCLQQLRALNTRASAMRDQLGTSMAQWYISTCVQKYRTGVSHSDSFMPELNERERAHLSAIFDQIEQQAMTMDPQGPQRDAMFITDKARQLIDVLRLNAEPNVRGIIFVEQRVQVTALAELLRRHLTGNMYNIGGFVGTSMHTNRKLSVADLVDLRNQGDDLRAFRDGSKNLMIATNVLEEGIDISACNLVICFDAPKNLVSFVQRRGRARQKNSKYLLFASAEDCGKSGTSWSALEAEMKSMYMEECRTLDEEDATEPQRHYVVPSTGATLTMNDAKSHLYHFCSVTSLHASSYVDLRPEFDTEQQPGSGAWTAEVELPQTVHSSVRFARSSKAWKNESDAIKDAAFEAYVALHKSKLVNDHLLPLVKDYGPNGDQQHLDQPSLVDVALQKSLNDVLWCSGDTRNMWSATELQLWLGKDMIVEVVLWLPTGLPHTIEPFELYWNAERTYQVRVTALNMAVTLSGVNQANFSECTAMLLRTVHRHRMSVDQTDFAVLFSSDELEGICNSVAKHGQTRDLPSMLAEHGIMEDPGLVDHQGRLYLLEGTTQNGLEVFVSRFPKRKDFLHPIDKSSDLSAAYTAKQAIEAQTATIDALPARYAILSAFVPSILHRMETSLLVRDLTQTLLKDININNMSLVMEAISSPAACEPHDYNRLEYLGDCMLKHFTELQVLSQHMDWPESYLSLEKDRIVRNSNLADMALQLGLEKYILSKPFTGSKWHPPYRSERSAGEGAVRQMSTKILADVVEALIGAAYEDGGLEKAFHCVKTLLSHEVWYEPRECFVLLLQAPSPTQALNVLPLETLAGHTFEHPFLLMESITHVSFPYNRTGMSYERLEFLGDSVLDIIITPKLYSYAKRKLKHWELHSIHAALVNSHLLGYCCLRYGLSSEQFEIVQNEAVSTTRLVHLYDFLRAGAQLSKIKRATVAAFEQQQERIEHALQNGKEYPWVELVTLSPPKFFSDIVESILGAIFIDTRGNLGACEAFVERIGILGYMQRILDDDVDCFSPKEMLGMVADRDEVKYVTGRPQLEGGNKTWTCTVQVGGTDVATAENCGSRTEAEVKAAHAACAVLQSTASARTRGKKRKRYVEQVATVEQEGGCEVDVDD